jgi:hypothetical protein
VRTTRYEREGTGDVNDGRRAVLHEGEMEEWETARFWEHGTDALIVKPYGPGRGACGGGVGGTARVTTKSRSESSKEA